MFLVLNLRGGYTNPQPESPAAQLSIAAGGLIKQCIVPDTNPAGIWQRDRSICFNVQILKSTSFRQVTGMDLPDTPVSVKSYAD